MTREKPLGRRLMEQVRVNGALIVKRGYMVEARYEEDPWKDEMSLDEAVKVRWESLAAMMVSCCF